MKTDIEIAQEAVLEPIVDVAARAGIKMDDLGRTVCYFTLYER